MKTQFPSLLLYLFYGVTAGVFLIKFIRAKEWKTFTWGHLKSSLPAFLMSIVPLTAAIFCAQFAGTDLGLSWAYFGGAAILGYVLSQIGLRAQLRSMILLMAAVCLSLFHPTDNSLVMVSAISGLAAWKLIENLLHKPESRLDDITAPIVWLVTCDYSVAQMGASATNCQALVLATFTVCAFLQWVEPVLLPNDTIYLKRVMLSLTGGLGVLVMITKVLLLDKLSIIAALAGAGFMITYLLQALDRNTDEQPSVSRGLKNILLVGIATLAATRLFGMQGLLVLAATSIMGPSTGSAVIAGLYWATRVLLQGYVVQNVDNVTGINLMHTYSSAAMYAGFIFIVISSLFIRDLKNRKTVCAMLLSTEALLPCAANYFMHGEPTGSLLCSLNVASVLMAFLTPALFAARAADQESIMVVSLLATSAACLSSGFASAGNGATNETRIVALCWLGFVIVLIALVDRFVFSDRHAKPNGTPPAPSDAAA